MYTDNARFKTTRHTVKITGERAIHAALFHGVQLFVHNPQKGWVPCSREVAAVSQVRFGNNWGTWAYGVKFLPARSERCAHCSGHR